MVPGDCGSGVLPSVAPECDPSYLSACEGEALPEGRRWQFAATNSFVVVFANDANGVDTEGVCARPLASLTTLVESEVEFVCSSCDVDAYSRGFFVNR